MLTLLTAIYCIPVFHGFYFYPRWREALHDDVDGMAPAWAIDLMAAFTFLFWPIPYVAEIVIGEEI